MVFFLLKVNGIKISSGSIINQVFLIESYFVFYYLCIVYIKCNL